MKRLSTFLLAALLFFAAHAQTQFAPKGAEWYHLGNDYDFWFVGSMHATTWLDHTVSTADTNIAGVNCRKLVTTRYQRTSEHPEIALSSTSGFYIYNNDDTVFVYNHYWAKFVPLYVYNVSENDTVTLPVPQYSGNPGEDSTFTFIIDSIRTVLYDTANLKTFYTRALYDEDANQYLNWGNTPISYGKYTQKLGGTASLSASIFPLSNSLVPDMGTINAAPCGNLQCYSDSSYSLALSEIACDSLPPLNLLSLTAVKKQGFNIYPNPASGAVHIEQEYPFAANSSLLITDISGRTLISNQHLSGKKAFTADVSGLTRGPYIIQVATEGKRYYTKLIIR